LAAIPLLKQEGGVIPHEASPSHGKVPDDVLVGATAGEFVIPADVIAWKGQEWAHKEVDKARKTKGELMMAQQAIPTGPQQSVPPAGQAPYGRPQPPPNAAPVGALPVTTQSNGGYA
jgi:hypothetical protein